MALREVDFDRVRIVLLRADSTLGLDTTVDFPAGADSISLSLPVLLEQSSEHFTLTMAMIDAVGDTVFRSGPDLVTASSGGIGTPPFEAPVRYTGTGANAKSVQIAGAPGAMYFGDTIVLTGQALDSAGSPIANTPIVWTSLDTSRARVPDPTVGRIVARPSRGPARIQARLLTPETTVVSIAVQPKPTAIVVASGGGQSGAVGHALGQQIVAQVNAADNLGVRGVMVHFQVTAGAGTLSVDSVLSDSLGQAKTQWTMGTVPGAATVTASAAGLSGAGSTTTFGATATPGAARTFVFSQQPTDVNASQAIAPAVSVTARDTFGNTATSFTSNITIAIGANPSAGTLTGGGAVAAVAGVATFANLRIDAAGSGYTLSATGAGLPAATSAAFNVLSNVAARLAFTVEPPASVTAGAAIAPAVQVKVVDAGGNLVTTDTGNVTIAILANPGASALGGTATVQAAGGVATFPNLTLDKAAAGYTLVATRAGLASDTTGAFAVIAGPATVLVETDTISPSHVAGDTFSVQVTAMDAHGNVATGYTDTVSVQLVLNPTGDTLRGTTSRLAVAGVAHFGNLRLRKVGVSSYRIQVNAVGLPSLLEGGFGISPSVKTKLVFTTPPPASVAAGAPMTIVVEARDSLDNAADAYGDTVHLAIGANPGGATLGGTLQAVHFFAAQFTTPYLNVADGGYTLVATDGALTPATSTPFAVTPAAAARVVFTTPPATRTAGLVLDTTRVAVQDTFGNLATSFADTVTLSLAVNPTGDTLRGTLKLPADSGRAVFTNLRLRKAAAGYRIRALAQGVVDTSAAFAITPAPPLALVFSTQPPASQQAGSAFTTVVTAEDSVGNTTPSFGNSITISFGANPGGSTLGGVTTVAPTAGVATFSSPFVNHTGTGYVLTASASGIGGGSSSTFDITPAPASALVVALGDQQVDTVGHALTDSLLLQVTDGFGNVVQGKVVSFGVTTGAGSLTTLTDTSDANGYVSSRWTLGAARGVQAVQAAGAGLASRTLSALGVPAGISKRWIGTTTDWGTAANWLPAGVPTSTDDVFVPSTSAFAPSLPLLSASFDVRDLKTDATAVISVGAQVLTVYRDLDAAAIVAGGGKVRLAGNPGVVRGAVPDVDLVALSGAATISVGGQLISTGRITLATSTSLLVGAADTLITQRVSIPAGAVTINGVAVIADTLALSGGSFVANGPATTVTTLVESGGQLAGTGQVAVVTRMDWTAGDHDSSGTLTTLPGSSTSISGVASRFIGLHGARTLAIGGSAIMANGVILRGGSGTFRVLPTGSLTLQGNDQFLNSSAPATLVFDNQGSVTRSGAAGPVTLGVPWSGNGGFSLGTDTLVLINSTASTDNAVDIAAGAVLRVISGSWTFGTSSVITGAGVFLGSSGTFAVNGRMAMGGTLRVLGGTNSFSAASRDTVGALDISSGVLGAGGALDVTGATSWTGGTIGAVGSTGSIRSLSGGTLTIGGAGSRDFRGNTALENAGTGTWSGAYTIYGGEASVIRNMAGATLTASGSPILSAYYGGSTTKLLNQGNLVVNSAGIVSATNLDNIGSFDVQAGTVMIGGGQDSGSTTIASGAAWVEFTGTRNVTPAATMSGAGTMSVTGGTLNQAGHLSVGALSVSAGSYNLNAAAADTVGALSISGGTIGGSGGLLVATGAASWTGGSIGVTGASGTIRSTGTLAIGTNASRDFRGGFAIEVQGTGTWSGTQTLYGGETAQLRILPGGSLTASGSPTFYGVYYGGANAVLVNHGTLSVNTGGTVISSLFDNEGLVDLQAGMLSVAGGTDSGAYAIGSGATFQVNGLTHTFAPTATVTGAGTLNVNSGTLNQGGHIGMSGGTVNVGGGTYNMAAATPDTATGFVLSGGTVTGSGGLFVVTGPLSWTVGDIGVPGSSGIIRSTGTLSISGTSSRNLRGAMVVENAGSGTWTGAHTIYGGETAQLAVAAGGTLTASSTPTFYGIYYGGAAARLVVRGSLIVNSAGTVTSSLMDNDGLVNVQAGTLAVGPGLDSGAYDIAAGGVFMPNLGARTLAPGVTLAGTGTLRVNTGTVTSAGSWAFPGTLQLTGGTIAINAPDTSTNLDLSSGTIGGSGQLIISGTASWTGGAFNGTGSARSLGSLTIGGTAGRDLRGGYLLENAGSGTWSGSHVVYGGEGAIMRNLAGGTLDISGTPTLSNFYAAPMPRLENAGTLIKSGAGNATFGGYLDNSGTAQINVGTLQLQGGASLGGSMSIAGSLDLNGATDTLRNGFTTTGTGSVDLHGGSTVLFAGAGQSANLAVLNVSGGTLSNADTINVNVLTVYNGTMTGAGVTRVPAGAGNAFNLAATGGPSLRGGHTIENDATGIWSGNTILYSGEGASIHNTATGTFDIQGNASLSYYYTTGNAPLTFINDGALIRSTSPTNVAFGGRLVNNGTLAVNAGTLQLLQDASRLIGPTSVASGATLEVASNDTLRSGLAVTGPGTVNVTGTLLLDTAGASATIDRLLLSSGTVSHAGTLNTHVFSWTGGTLTGAGTTRVVAGAGDSLLITTTAGKNLRGHHTLLNQATAIWGGGNSIIYSGDTSVFRNTGTLDIQNDANFNFFYGTVQPTLDNQGTLTRSTSANPAIMGGYFRNTGTLNVTSGVLRLGSNAFIGGTPTLTSGTALDLTGSDTLAAGVSIAGPGAVTMNGATLTLQSGLAPTVDRLDMISGSISHTGQLNIKRFNWSGGAITGAGTTTVPSGAGDSLNILGTAGRDLRGGHTLQNGATAVWSGANTIYSGEGAVLRNLSTGTLDLEATALLNGSFYSGAVGRLWNQGALTRSTSASTMTIADSLINDTTGTIAVNTGTLTFSHGSSLIGAATVAAGSILDLSGAQGHRVLKNMAFGGTGTLQVSGGTLNLNGHTVSTGGNFTTVSSGALQMTNAADTLLVNGNANFSGTSTSGLLTNGMLMLLGNFAQAGSGNAFTATGSHLTQFAGAALQTISFANPGSLNSHFQNLQILGTGTDTLLTNVDAEGQLITDTAIATNQRIAAGTGVSLSAQGPDVAGTTFSHVQLVIGPGAAMTRFDGITFQNFLGSETQMAVTRAPGSEQWGGFFGTGVTWYQPLTTGKYLTVTRQGATGTYNLTINNSSPSCQGDLTNFVRNTGTTLTCSP